MENNLVQHHRRCGKGATMIDVPHHDSGMDNIRHVNLLIETTEDNNIRKKCYITARCRESSCDVEYENSKEKYSVVRSEKKKQEEKETQATFNAAYLDWYHRTAQQ